MCKLVLSSASINRNFDRKIRLVADRMVETGIDFRKRDNFGKHELGTPHGEVVPKVG